MTDCRETLSQELRRLVMEYRADGPNAEEAWNLIADCVEDNIDVICAALEDGENASGAHGTKED